MTLSGADDRLAQRHAYWWELSMRQVEVSRTLVFDAPRRARSFFEALVTDNIGIGRPEETSLVFARRVTKRTRERFGTRIVSRGTDVRVDFRYKHSRVKQYLKAGRALRVETVINKPSDLGLAARLQHLPELIERARGVNQRLLMIERAGQSCAIGSALFERIHQPYNQEGHRAGALRFGDLRAMALAGALCCVLPAVTGFTNKSLRGLVAGLLGQDYSTNKMSYDLRRLRLHGLIQRLPRSNTYRPHRRGHPRRRLLHQAAKPAAATTAGRRQTASQNRNPPRAQDPRIRCQRLHTQREARPRRIKLVTTARLPATKSN